MKITNYHKVHDGGHKTALMCCISTGEALLKDDQVIFVLNTKLIGSHDIYNFLYLYYHPLMDRHLKVA